MDKWQWLALSLLLTNLLISVANANEEETTLELEFLEFLGEGRTLGSDYHDPLQMQDWLQKEMVDAGQQQEVNEDE